MTVPTMATTTTTTTTVVKSKLVATPITVVFLLWQEILIILFWNETAENARLFACLVQYSTVLYANDY